MKYDPSEAMKTFLGRVTGIAERLKRFYEVEVSDDQLVARMISALPAEYSGLIRTLNDMPPENMTLTEVQKKILVENWNGSGGEGGTWADFWWNCGWRHAERTCGKEP